MIRNNRLVIKLLHDTKGNAYRVKNFLKMKSEYLTKKLNKKIFRVHGMEELD